MPRHAHSEKSLCLKGPSSYVLSFKPAAVSSLEIPRGSDVFLVSNPDPPKRKGGLVNIVQRFCASEIDVANSLPQTT